MDQVDFSHCWKIRVVIFVFELNVLIDCSKPVSCCFVEHLYAFCFGLFWMSIIIIIIIIIIIHSNRSSKVSDCIFEIHQPWQSGFSRVYSNSCCSCWFEAEIIKIGPSSYKMYSNNILNFYDNFKCPFEKGLETYRMHLVCLVYYKSLNIWEPTEV